MKFSRTHQCERKKANPGPQRGGTHLGGEKSPSRKDNKKNEGERSKRDKIEHGRNATKYAEETKEGKVSNTAPVNLQRPAIEGRGAKLYRKAGENRKLFRGVLMEQRRRPHGEKRRPSKRKKGTTRGVLGMEGKAPHVIGGRRDTIRGGRGGTQKKSRTQWIS